MDYVARYQPKKLSLLYSAVEKLNLSWSITGPIINGLIAFAPSLLLASACSPQQPETIKDLGKMLAYGCLVSFLAAQFIVYKLYHSDCLKHRDYQQDFKVAERHVSEVFDALESAVFRYAVVMSLTNSSGLSLLACLRCVWPIMCLLTKHKRGSHQHHQDSGLVKYKKLHTIGEALYNGESLSSALTTFGLLIYNTVMSPYVDVGLPKYLNQQAWLIGITWAVGEVVGMASVRYKHSWKAVRFAEGFVNSLFYMFSTIVSQVACSQPSWMNHDGFTDIGSAICIIALVPSIFCAVANGDSTQATLAREHNESPPLQYTPL